MGDARTSNANACEAPGLCGGPSSCATLIPALVAAFTLPQAQISIKTSDDTRSFTNAPARREPMQAWRVCGLDTFPGRRKEVDGMEDMDESDQAKKINSSNAGQAPQVLRI